MRGLCNDWKVKSLVARESSHIFGTGESARSCERAGVSRCHCNCYPSADLRILNCSYSNLYLQLLSTVRVPTPSLVKLREVSKPPTSKWQAPVRDRALLEQ
jgi:hypothetical protein